MARKTKSAAPVPPHRTRPLALAEPTPAEVWPTAHGLTAAIYLAATAECSFCEQQAARVSAEEGLCAACIDRWGTRDQPKGKAS